MKRHLRTREEIIMSAKKLQKGESKRKDGRYMYRYTDINGKRHSIYAKTLADLRIQERQIARDKNELDEYVTTGASVNFVFDRYISMKTNLKQNTRSRIHSCSVPRSPTASAR